LGEDVDGDDLGGRTGSGVEGGVVVEAEVAAELVALVRERIGPVAYFKTAAVVAKLPKTRSGKILRGTIRKMADGVPYKVPPTIEDPAALDDLGKTLSRLGYPQENKS